MCACGCGGGALLAARPARPAWRCTESCAGGGRCGELTPPTHGCPHRLTPLQVADAILNWESLVMPALRLGVMLLAVAFMLVLEYVVMPLTPWVK